MKSLVSLLTVGLLLIGSHVSAAPQQPAPADASLDVAPDAAGAEGNATAFLATIGDESEDNARAVNMRQLTRKYQRYVRRTLRKRRRGDKCTLNNVSVRKEWGSMSRRQRTRYTDAVKCLYNKKTPLSNPAQVPGARNRLDDFVASHIQQGQNIHFDGYLFAWHRNFVWAYEQALRKECGYRGPTPYWDWTLNPDNIGSSPVFDGSATSLGGNGETITQGGTFVAAFGLNVTLPPGTGGGCVKSGPFTDLTVNLGLNPVIVGENPRVDLTANLTTVGVYASTDEESATAYREESPVIINEALRFNPRCLTRSFNPFWSNMVRTKDVEFLLSCPNVDCLEKRSDGWELDRTLPQPLLHASGHFAIGGLQNDPFASPGDPAFYLHHAAFDRLYSIWQGQDETRVYQVGGTKTPFNIPPSDPVTLDDTLEFGVVAGSAKMRDLLSTIDGPYCYMYE